MIGEHTKKSPSQRLRDLQTEQRVCVLETATTLRLSNRNDSLLFKHHTHRVFFQTAKISRLSYKAPTAFRGRTGGWIDGGQDGWMDAMDE